MAINTRQRKTGVRYIAKVTLPNGDQISKTFRRKVDAVAWERDQRQSLSEVSTSSSCHEWAGMTVRELAEHWLENYAVTRLQESSLDRNKGVLRLQILPHLGTTRISELTSRRVEVWLNLLRDKGKLAPRSCNKARALLSKLYNDAYRWGFVKENPVTVVRPFEVAQEFPPFLLPEEIRAFLAYVEDHRPELYVGFALALYTGTRKGELRALRWDCVDFYRGFITVCRTYCNTANKEKRRTKGGRDRSVPINPVLRDILIEAKSHRVDAGPAGLVLESFPWGVPSKLITSLCKGAGVTRISFHGLRHTFASNLVMNGIPIFDVQKLLGHKSIETTQRYAHLAPDHLKGATDSLNFGRAREVPSNVVRLQAL